MKCIVSNNLSDNYKNDTDACIMLFVYLYNVILPMNMEFPSSTI